MDWRRADQIATSHLGSVLVVALVAATAFVLGGQYQVASVTEVTEEKNQEKTSDNSTIQDLQQAIATPAPTTAVSNQTTTPTATTQPAGLININSASQVELESLPGIGPSKAGAIISYRLTNGPFLRVDDLVNVKGIGPKTLESLRPLVTI